MRKRDLSEPRLSESHSLVFLTPTLSQPVARVTSRRRAWTRRRRRGRARGAAPEEEVLWLLLSQSLPLGSLGAGWGCGLRHSDALSSSSPPCAPAPSLLFLRPPTTPGSMEVMEGPLNQVSGP